MIFSISCSPNARNVVVRCRRRNYRPGHPGDGPGDIALYRGLIVCRSASTGFCGPQPVGKGDGAAGGLNR
jgi:hypothetical protein